MTPQTLFMPARTMVASWDLSPHSAMKVIVKQFRNTYITTFHLYIDLSSITFLTLKTLRH